LRDAEKFFDFLFPGVVGLHPSSFHRRVRKLRRFLEPLRRDVLSEMIGDPETLLIDSTLLSVLHPRQVSQGSGFPGAAWVRWGSGLASLAQIIDSAQKLQSLHKNYRRLLEGG
jgi:hypothetical protein